MLNLDLQKIYSSIKYHNTEKWVQPINISREETRDNNQGDAKNRQEASYHEAIDALTSKLSENRGGQLTHL